MWCNKKLIYEFITTGTQDGFNFAMAKIQYLQIMLSEHPFNFFNPESENGRKIFWYGLPATIKVKSHNTWEIEIIPDYEFLSKDEWWNELENRQKKLTEKINIEDDDDFDEQKNIGYINWGDALSDQHIYWFR